MLNPVRCVSNSYITLTYVQRRYKIHDNINIESTLPSETNQYNVQPKSHLIYKHIVVNKTYSTIVMSVEPLFLLKRSLTKRVKHVPFTIYLKL